MVLFLQERGILIQHMDQAHSLQGAAEKEADATMLQLEEFINEQEKLVCSLPVNCHLLNIYIKYVIICEQDNQL